MLFGGSLYYYSTVNMYRNCEMLATDINWMASARHLREKNATTSQETDIKTSCHVSSFFCHSSRHIFADVFITASIHAKCFDVVG